MAKKTLKQWLGERFRGCANDVAAARQSGHEEATNEATLHIGELEREVDWQGRQLAAYANAMARGTFRTAILEGLSKAAAEYGSGMISDAELAEQTLNSLANYWMAQAAWKERDEKDAVAQSQTNAAAILKGVRTPRRG